MPGYKKRLKKLWRNVNVVEYASLWSLTFSAGNYSFSCWIAWTERICDATERTAHHQSPKQPCKFNSSQLEIMNTLIRDRLICLPQQCKYKQLLWIEWKVGYEIRRKKRGHGIGFLKPNGQQAKDGSSAHSRKKATPIITHGKIRCGYLNAKQDTTNRCGKARSDTNGTGGRQHFRVTRFIFVNALEWCHHFTQQLSNDTGDVHKGTLNRYIPETIEFK